MQASCSYRQPGLAAPRRHAAPRGGHRTRATHLTKLEITDLEVDALELDSLTPELPLLLVEMGVRRADACGGLWYDPERLAAALAARPGELAARSVRVAAALGGFITCLLADAASGRLADRLPSFPSTIAFALIEEELGRPLGEVYSYISPEPVAAASLGQVYKARLRSTGEEVAVKVQRPGIGESIAMDMVLLRRLMVVVDANLPRYTPLSQPLVPLVDEFAARLFGELDYEAEGRNAGGFRPVGQPRAFLRCRCPALSLTSAPPGRVRLPVRCTPPPPPSPPPPPRTPERFAKLYAHVPRVRVPGIKWEATARRVLTMDWIDGVKLTDQAGMAARGLDIVDFVDVGIECTLRQLLESGFFHADPHPGNLLAAPDGDLVYLDFGMMSEAPQSARYAIIAHVVHLVNRDYLAMCLDYYQLEFMDPSVDTTPIAPALAAFFDDVLQARGAPVGRGCWVPAYYALILRSMTVLEGLALTADRNYKLLAKAYPYMARRLLTDPAPELRASFEDLILSRGRVRWNRLENLFEEGSKSQARRGDRRGSAPGRRRADFDPVQLWLLAEWVCSEGGRAVRGPLAAELVRLVDALIASSAREQLAARAAPFGGAELAARLVPAAQDEKESRARAVLLWRWLSGGGALPLPPLPAGGGLFAVPGPAEVQAYLASLQERLAGASPRLAALLERPGAQELVAEVGWGLAQRFAARSIKFVAGLQAPPPSAGGGSSGADGAPKAAAPPRAAPAAAAGGRA
eukprot:scaffold4.g5015.t1